MLCELKKIDPHKVEIVNCTEPRISCNNSDLNGVNGNDTFSPHSPKVVTENWLLRPV